MKMQAIWKMRKSVFIQKKVRSKNASHLENEKISIYTKKKYTAKMQAVWKRRKSVFIQKQYFIFLLLNLN